MHYLFDVDGTLTPSREKINPAFGHWFLGFVRTHDVSLVSGSDYNKTVEQLGSDIIEAAKFVFSCSGNVVREAGEIVHEHNWSIPEPVMDYLKSELFTSPYEERFGKHFEHRTGMMNFSVIGRNAKGRDRTDYYKWDLEHGERARIAKTINDTWPDLFAVVGGETGIDISSAGTDKSQVLEWIKDDILFIGDRTDPIGNDYTLAYATVEQRRGTFETVNDWKDTWEILKKQ
jgi:phosphomannomutase